MSHRIPNETASKTSKSATPRTRANVAAAPTAAICKPAIPSLAVRLAGRRPRATSSNSWLLHARTRLANRCGEVTAKEPERITPVLVASISRGTNSARGAMTIRGPTVRGSSGATPQRSPFIASKARAKGGVPGYHNNTGTPDDSPMRDNRLLLLFYLHSIADRAEELP